MIKLSGSQKRKLRATAHSLKPVVMVGSKGITDSLINAVSGALEEHELIKVKFQQFKEDKKDLSKIIEEKTSANIIGMVGHTMILFRESSEEERKNHFIN